MPTLPLTRATSHFDLMSFPQRLQEADAAPQTRCNWNIKALVERKDNTGHWTLQGGTLTAAAVTAIVRTKPLYSLALVDVDLSDSTALQGLSDARDVGHVYMSHSRLPISLPALRALDSLSTHLHVRCDRIDGDTLAQLVALDHLIALHTRCGFSIEEMQVLARSASLRSLTQAARFDEPASRALSSLKVKELQLIDGNLTQSAMNAFYRNGHIESLTLRDVGVLHEWLDGFLNLYSLREYRVIRPRDPRWPDTPRALPTDPAFIRKFAAQALFEKGITVQFVAGEPTAFARNPAAVACDSIAVGPRSVTRDAVANATSASASTTPGAQNAWPPGLAARSTALPASTPQLPVLRSIDEAHFDLTAATGYTRNTVRDMPSGNANWTLGTLGKLDDEKEHAGHLTLQQGILTASAILAIAQQPRLRSLALIDVDLRDQAAVDTLSGVKRIEDLFVLSSAFSLPFTTLASLNISCTRLHLRLDLTTAALLRADKLDRLTALYLPFIFLNGAEMEAISRAPALKILSCRPPITPKAIATLSALKVETLILDNDWRNGVIRPIIANLDLKNQLQNMPADAPRSTPQSRADLQRRLMSNAMRCAYEVLEAVADNASITSLALSDMPLSPDLMKRLLPMPALRHLAVQAGPTLVIQPESSALDARLPGVTLPFMQEFAQQAGKRDRAIDVTFSGLTASLCLSEP